MYYGGYSSMSLILMIIPIILMLAVSGNVKTTYAKYSRIRNSRNLTGYEIARRILDQNGLQDVQIIQGHGELSDFYDPTRKIVNLSPGVYQNATIAAAAVAAHEVGHAIQHQTGYSALVFRNSLLPMTLVANKFGWIAIMIGFLFSSPSLLYIGIGLLVVIAAFQLVTLPVEFNASSRALRILEGSGMLAPGEEILGAQKMLKAAAMTYVAALISTILEIVRLLLIARDRD